ncbi:MULTISPECIES: hypothetical protein [Aphanothece]|uniref:hypothetical protein n=1 Tax=Aphanothece TaxID=1121 RepID=UPI00398E984D
MVPPNPRSRPPAAALALALLAAGVLLGSCQNRAQQAERQRQEQALQAAAAQRRALDALVERCRAGQAELVKAADALAATETALANLQQRRYSATARPKAPDPAELQRFTISDQELERERHQQAVQAWQQKEQQRRARWQAEQRQERQRLVARREQQRQALVKANPAVLAAGSDAALNAGLNAGLNSEALAAYRSCERDNLASLKRP